MKTLCQLVSQYKSDVETRIQCIKEEFDSNHCDVNDYVHQLAHWQATLAEINETIESSRIAFEMDNPEIDKSVVNTVERPMQDKLRLCKKCNFYTWVYEADSLCRMCRENNSA